MRFYTGSTFPAKYYNAIFIARHGSWNKTNKIGGDIYVVYLNKDGTVKGQEPFMTGFIQNNNYVGRPVDVLPMKDGSLLVSDDYEGAISHHIRQRQSRKPLMEVSRRGKRLTEVPRRAKRLMADCTVEVKCRTLQPRTPA